VFLACGAFKSAYALALKAGLQDACENISVRPGGRIERTANLVKIIEPGIESRLTYLWWFPRSDVAARLVCTAGNKPLGFCAAAYKDFNRRIRKAAA
jgi:hypothetical protein